MKLTSLSSIGAILVNPKSKLKLPECNPCGAEPPCLYSFDDLTGATAVSINGVVYELTATTVEGVTTEIANLLDTLTLGNASEGDAFVTSAVIDYVVVGAQNVTPTVMCETIEVCNFKGSVNGEMATITINGAATPLATGDYTYTVGDDAANDTVAGQLEADLLAAIQSVNPSVTEVEVIVNDDLEQFDFVIPSLASDEIIADTVPPVTLTKCDCGYGFDGFDITLD